MFGMFDAFFPCGCVSPFAIVMIFIRLLYGIRRWNYAANDSHIFSIKYEYIYVCISIETFQLQEENRNKIVSTRKRICYCSVKTRRDGRCFNRKNNGTL